MSRNTEVFDINSKAGVCLLSADNLAYRPLLALACVLEFCLNADVNPGDGSVFEFGNIDIVDKLCEGLAEANAIASPPCIAVCELDDKLVPECFLACIQGVAEVRYGNIQASDSFLDILKLGSAIGYSGDRQC